LKAIFFRVCFLLFKEVSIVLLGCEIYEELLYFINHDFNETMLIGFEILSMREVRLLPQKVII